jgi:hypothetical protein
VAATAGPRPGASLGGRCSPPRNFGTHDPPAAALLATLLPPRSVAGSAALTREDLQAALDEMQRKLMERNVAEEIAAQVRPRGR